MHNAEDGDSDDEVEALRACAPNREPTFPHFTALPVPNDYASTCFQDNPVPPARLLLAAIGCNLAWGIIDAVMYIMNCITVRSGKVRLVEAVQQSSDEQAALTLIQNEIEPELQELLDSEDAEALSRSVLDVRAVYSRRILL